MAREEHVQAVGFAGIEVEELEQQLSGCREKAEQVVAVVVNAVGEEPSTDSGRQALRDVRMLRLAISELMARCEEAKQHLNDYGRGI